MTLNDPIRKQVVPKDSEMVPFTAMMEDSLAEDRHFTGTRSRPPLSGPGADAGNDPMRLLLPILHPLTHRRRSLRDFLTL
jgi:hypothetical protein